MIYYFQGGSELLQLDVRSRQDIWLASSLTRLQLVNVTDKFYDSAKEKEKAVKMSNEAFHQSILSAMAMQGYKCTALEDAQL